MQQHLLREQLYRDLLGIAELEGPTGAEGPAGQPAPGRRARPHQLLPHQPRRAPPGVRDRRPERPPRAPDLARRRAAARGMAAAGRRLALRAGEDARRHPGPGRLPERADRAASSTRRRRPTSTPSRCSAARPRINKYYIMDLAPGRSFVEWAVKHGHTTFSISYRNPDASLRDAGVDTYLRDGLLQALRVVQEITGAETGQRGRALPGRDAGHHARRVPRRRRRPLGEQPHPDEHPGRLLRARARWGPSSIPPRWTRMLRTVEERGYPRLPARWPAPSTSSAPTTSLQLRRHGWLMGEEPPAFDLLAWNDDGTRIPARFLREYLGGLLPGQPLATDALVARRTAARGLGHRPGHLHRRRGGGPHHALAVGLQDDGPPRRGKVRFVLTSSGHIAGVVNPPSKSAAYWVGRADGGAPDAWQSGATRHQDTWWQDWARWIGSGPASARRLPRSGVPRHPPLRARAGHVRPRPLAVRGP